MLKKIIALLLALLTLTALLCSCKKSSLGKRAEAEAAATLADTDEEQAAVSSGLYDKYAIEQIYPFHNGLAAFTVKEIKNLYTNYYYGYIDTKGNVVIEPTYVPQNNIVKSFLYDCVSVEHKKAVNSTTYTLVTRIIDKKGNVKFEEKSDNVTYIGEVSAGYFVVETEKVEISGNVYTATYYRASDLKAVATFNNCSSGNSKNVSEETGDFSVYDKTQNKTLELNIADYDSSFKPKEELSLGFDIDEHSTFSESYNTYKLSKTNDGVVATVKSNNGSGAYFYSIVKADGTILFGPQRDIGFTDVFSNELCPAKDFATEKYGYVDTKGNWKIQPKYTSATEFSEGYAIVDKKIVIDTTGKAVLAPAGYGNKVTSLSGKYKWEENSSIYFTFSDTGSLTMDGTYSYVNGTYKIDGTTITLSGFGTVSVSFPLTDGTYTFYKNGNKLVIDGKSFTLIQ